MLRDLPIVGIAPRSKRDGVPIAWRGRVDSYHVFVSVALHVQGIVSSSPFHEFRRDLRSIRPHERQATGLQEHGNVSRRASTYSSNLFFFYNEPRNICTQLIERSVIAVGVAAAFSRIIPRSLLESCGDRAIRNIEVDNGDVAIGVIVVENVVGSMSKPFQFAAQASFYREDPCKRND